MIERQLQHVEIGIAIGAERQNAGKRDRQHEDVDRDEVERQQEPGHTQLFRRAVFNHRDVELARQQDDGETGKQRHHDPAADGRVIGYGPHGLLIIRGKLPQMRGTVEEDEEYVKTDGAHGDELDQRFHRNRQNKSVLMFGGIGVAGAEHDGKPRHDDGDDQWQIEEIKIAAANAVIAGIDHCRHRAGNGFQLQRDIGNGADERDDRDDHRHGGILAVSGGDEICDGSQFFRFRQFNDAANDRHADGEGEDRPGIDAEKFQPPVCREPHTAEIGPGRAIDCQAERIDERTPLFRSVSVAAVPVPIACNRKQQQDISEGRTEYDPPRKHASSPCKSSLISA
ncbi:hypothetical protein D3C86_1182060 [compost metagenome]